MDSISPKQCSYIISSIRSKNAKLEMLGRRHLHALGFRYRLHPFKVPRNPDIVLPKWHTVIFVNDCFWQGHDGCKAASMLKSNVKFWNAKFERNVARDRTECATLEATGWHVIVPWECEGEKSLKNIGDLIKKAVAQNEHTL